MIIGPGSVSSGIGHETESSNTPVDSTKNTVEKGQVGTPSTKESDEASEKLAISQLGRVGAAEQDPNSDSKARIVAEKVALIRTALGEASIDAKTVVDAPEPQELVKHLLSFVEERGEDLGDIRFKFQALAQALPKGEQKDFIKGLVVELKNHEAFAQNTFHAGSAKERLISHVELVLVTQLPTKIAEKFSPVRFEKQPEIYSRQLTAVVEKAFAKVAPVAVTPVQKESKEIVTAETDNPNVVEVKVTTKSDAQPDFTVHRDNAFKLVKILATLHNASQVTEKQSHSVMQALGARFDELNPLQKQERLDRVEKALERASYSSENRQQSSQQSDQTITGQFGIMSAGGQNNYSDEPIEAVQGVDAVESYEESGHLATASAGDDAMTESWEGLTHGELAVQVANGNLVLGISSSTYDAQDELRRSEETIKQLMLSIESGNNDLIGLALIMIADRSKETLRKTAGQVIEAMKFYDEQTSIISDKLGELTGKEGDYAARMQGFSNDMNRYSNSRNTAVSVLRDTRAASDVLDNTAKAWLDADGPHGRALARWQ